MDMTSPVFWLAALVLWLAFAYAYGRWWSWKTNKRRRAEYRRRKG